MINPKIIERIKKLLELTTSDNESEAQLAMDQAKKLMLKHSLKETDFLNTEIIPEIVQEVYSSEYLRKLGVQEAIPSILTTIAPIFGTQPFVKIGRNFKTFHLLGFKANIEITKFALDSLLAQGAMDARREYRRFRTVTFGLSFWTGFAEGLKRKFSQIKELNEDGIIIYDRVKDELDRMTNGGKGFSGTRYDGVARETGFKSGMDAQIRSGISNKNEGKLLE